MGCLYAILIWFVAIGLPILLLSGISECTSCLLDSTDSGFLQTIIIIISVVSIVVVLAIFGRHRDNKSLGQRVAEMLLYLLAILVLIAILAFTENC